MDKYHFEDFILDDTFKKYILRTDDESVKIWEDWIRRHPESEPEIKRASEVLLTLINHKKQDSSDSKAALKLLLKNIENQPGSKSARKLYLFFARVAAVLLAVAGSFWLGYSLFSKFQTDAIRESFNEIIVPVGEKSQIVLPDGTHVWINSGSRFKYPVNFGIVSREVALEGEAYFDVTQRGNEFIVNTHDAEIKVLGTAFNVKSYPEDLRTQTTVVRGLVKVISKEKGIKPVLVRPDQMAVIRKSPDKNISPINNRKVAIIENVNSTVVTSWKDQLLVFADETFEDLAIKMERWFNMKIRIDDNSLKKERYTGKFVNNETIYQVLEAIAVTTPIKYGIENDEIIITRKKP